MTVYTFYRVQYGYWGQTRKDQKPIRVKANSADEARFIVNCRKDAHKRLRNGDSLGWQLEQ